MKNSGIRAAAVALVIVICGATASAQSQELTGVADTTLVVKDTIVHGPDSLAARSDTVPRFTRDLSDDCNKDGCLVLRGKTTRDSSGDCNKDGCLALKEKTATCGNGPGDVALRRTAVGAAFVGGNAALFAYFKRAWWSGERAPHFFFHADWDQNFRDQDKFGHMLGGYHLARGGYALLKSACMSPKKALILSSAYAAAFQLQIEVWDGLYKKYGFSYADVIANTTGLAIAVLHETHPKTLAIKPTISYWPSAEMRNANNIPGELRPSLDYSGQTYWFSADVNALLPDNAKRYWPSFVRLSAGHSITDWIDPKTGANIRAKRKILLSLDFDPEKLPGDNRLWKTVKHQLSYIHFPGPTLQLTPKLVGIGFYK